MPKRSSKKRHVNEIVKAIVDEATDDGERQEQPEEPQKNSPAVALGRLRGLKGCSKARAKKLSTEQRKAIAEKAAKVRWGKRQNC